MANTELGNFWIEKLGEVMFLKETAIEDILEQQPALQGPVKRPSYTFPSNVCTIEGSVKFMKRYYRGSLNIRILSALSNMMPRSMSSYLKRIYYSIFK